MTRLPTGFTPLRFTFNTRFYKSNRMQSSNDLKELRFKIRELEGQIKGTSDREERTAMLNLLAARQHKEVLLRQSEKITYHACPLACDVNSPSVPDGNNPR